jgi:DNA-damage-inducible protein D
MRVIAFYEIILPNPVNRAKPCYQLGSRAIHLELLGKFIMSLSIVTQSNLSPFDSIRKFTEAGLEFWSARELMKLLGFSKWEKFQQVVLDAIEDVEIIDPGTSGNHFPQTGKKSGGRTLIDYNLSRLGCYHTTLACKHRTIEVAAARRYFAAKTREAELTAQQPKTKIQILAELATQMAAQEQIQIAQAKEIELIKQQQALESARIDEITQLTHQHDAEIDRVFSPNGHYFSVIGYARNRGIKIGIETAKEIGRKCSAYCKENQIKIEKLNDPRFGTVGSYPESIIDLYL